MEGRWASLVLRALYDKALDLTDVTRDDPASIAREALLVREAGRRASAATRRDLLTYCACKDTEKGNENSVELLKELEDLERPWLSAGDRRDTRSKTEKMVDYYKQVMAAQNGSTGQTAEPVPG